jgi:hypothetical protein
VRACYNTLMRLRVGLAITAVVAAGLVARAIQSHHDTVERIVNRFRRGDLAEAGADKLRAAAELGSERLRVAVEEGWHDHHHASAGTSSR